MKQPLIVKGRLADVHRKEIYTAEIIIEGDRIKEIRRMEMEDAVTLPFIIPGFVDAHVHIESSMLIPSEFARLAVTHGTVATVSDPHEIANVCGLPGIEFMIEDGNTVPFKFYFGAPSCVPATVFETAGAAINSSEIDDLLRRRDIYYLSEMMNFPGVLHGDAEVLKKIEAAKKHNKPVDGHAPGLTGDLAKKYIGAGISTDHECFTREEALFKLQSGMKIIIREGSAAKNFEALIDLLNDYPDMVMFCSDDKHPDSLVEGHINQLAARAVAKGIDVFKVLKAVSVNPVLHYKLKVGLLRTNDFADFILVKDLRQFETLQTYINGELVSENGQSLITRKKTSNTEVNNFNCSYKQPKDFLYSNSSTKNQVPVIEALDGQLITNKFFITPKINNNEIVIDPDNDILKIAVVNRYHDRKIAIGLIKNFGLKKGALASSVAHDSHNIVTVGTDDESICRAVNLVIEQKGGISCVGEKDRILPLPVAGLMSTDDGFKIAENYSAIDKAAKELGSKLSSPFMTLSFMALLVIPHLKLSDKGIFDGDSFNFL